DGKYDLALYGDTSGFSGPSHAAVFDGTLHSLAFAFDGTAKMHGMWSDEAHPATFGPLYGPFGSRRSFDTKNRNILHLGCPRPAPAASGSAGDGAALKTRALVIMRLPASYLMPSVGQLTTVLQQLRANPAKLILASAF